MEGKFKISDVIAHLEKVKEEKGDLEIWEFWFGEYRPLNHLPEPAFLKKRWGREIKIHLWDEGDFPHLKDKEILKF